MMNELLITLLIAPVVIAASRAIGFACFWFLHDIFDNSFDYHLRHNMGVDTNGKSCEFTQSWHSVHCEILADTWLGIDSLAWIDKI